MTSKDLVLILNTFLKGSERSEFWSHAMLYHASQSASVLLLVDHRNLLRYRLLLVRNGIACDAELALETAYDRESLLPAGRAYFGGSQLKGVEGR